MKPFEHTTLEFKEIYTPNIKKEIVAFANTDGGTIYIGLRDDGTVIGVDDPDKVMLQITGAIQDAICPDVRPFTQVRTVLREDKPVIEITVETGSGKPYYLRDKGLKPNGVYIRRGSSSQPLSDEGIREMILQTSGRSYEACRSMNQELTFTALTQEMALRHLEFGPAQMRTLHLIDGDGLYTNLALLLSDQCEHTIKVAIHQGRDKCFARDRKEFSGSLLQQLNEVYHLLDLLNQTKATISGLQRTDKRDYPEEAVREALLNSIVHRDYSFSGSTLINLYEDRLELSSLGGLVPGLSMESILLGISQSRNPHLAAVFYRMKLIESYGTGIERIRRVYAHENCKPNFETAPGAFRTTLPNCNEVPPIVYQAQTIRELGPDYRVNSSPYYYTRPLPASVLQPQSDFSDAPHPVNHTPTGTIPTKAMPPKELLYQYALQHGVLRRKEAEALLGLRTTSVYNLLKELCDEGRLQPEGNSRNRYYRPL